MRAWTDPFERLPFHCEDPDQLGALERYLRDHKPVLAPSTAKNEPYYAKASRGIFRRHAGQQHHRIENSGIYLEAPQDGRANATINKELRILIAVLRRAKRWHLFSDEIKSLRVRKSKVGRALELGEKLWLLRASQAKKGWWRARQAMVLALNTTMRAGEIRGLQWQDIDWLERTLHVRRGKTDESQREIWLNDEAFSAITQLREESKEVFGEDLAPEWYLFFSWPRNREPDPRRPVASWRTAWRRMTRVIACPGVRRCFKIWASVARTKNVAPTSARSKVRSPVYAFTICATRRSPNFPKAARATRRSCRSRATSIDA